MVKPPAVGKPDLILAAVRKLERQAGDILPEDFFFTAAPGVDAQGGPEVAEAIDQAIALNWLEATSEGYRLTSEGHAAAFASGFR